jgi:hypothetical protein
MTKTLRVLVAVTALAAAGTVVAAGTVAHADNPHRGGLDPAHFSHPRPNPYFPLDPGLTIVSRGTEDGEHLVDRLYVTHRTKVIEGVEARVVHDVVHRADGSLAERTADWYAADDDGNVWYLGESTATYDENGRLDSREGSWQAGVHGARAGLIMPAHPRPTDAYRQEFLKGHAEDQAWIVSRDEHVTVPVGTFHRVVRSYEWTRLEPGVVSLKLYARGVGIVKERDVAGGNETYSVVSVSHH